MAKPTWPQHGSRWKPGAYNDWRTEMIVTVLPKSRLKLFDCADAARKAGQNLYQNGRALVAARANPGRGWHRVGVIVKVAA